MTSDQVSTHAEKGRGTRTRPHYAIEWTRIATVFSQCLLVATLVCSYSGAKARTHRASILLGKVIAECVEDTLSRFIFWLTADLNIERSGLNVETREAIRAELSKTVKPLTDLQIAQMNARVNSLPDYLRAFYLEDYFDSMTRRSTESRSL